MAPSILSSSLRLTTRLLSTFKSPIRSCGRRMMTTTVSGPSPCLMLPPTLEGFGGNIIYNFYNLTQNKVINFNKNQKPGKGTKIVGSSHGWLAMYNQRNGNLVLTNPVTRRHVNLPPSSDVSKVVISCDPEQDECQAMKIGESRRLAYCRPGGQRPTEWTTIGAPRRRPPNDNYGRYYEDVVYSSRHKFFFCVTELTWGDDLEVWDVASDPPRLRWENRDDLLDKKYRDWLMDREEEWFEMFKYLVFVEQADQLFLVTRHLVRQMAPDGTSIKCRSDESCPYKTVAFDVKIDWELDGEGGALSHLNGGSLDGLAMFVGLNHTFAVSATKANGLKPNSIYFTDDKLLTPPERWLGTRSEMWLSKKFGGHDIGIFDYENKTISPCYYPCDLESFKKIMPAPIWFTPTHY